MNFYSQKYRSFKVALFEKNIFFYFFNKMEIPDKSTSPIRSVLKQTNNQTNENIANLTNSVESKRQLLNQVYYDMKATHKIDSNDQDRKIYSFKPTEATWINKNENILKHVHFESMDTSNNESLNQTRKISTFTIEMIGKETKLQTNSKYSSKLKSPVSKAHVNKPSIKIDQIPSGKIEKQKKTSHQGQVINFSKISTRQVLTLQQKRQLMLDNKAKLEKAIEEMRKKILLRKFGYIWLRIHFYPKIKLKSTKLLFLPSQLE